MSVFSILSTSSVFSATRNEHRNFLYSIAIYYCLIIANEVMHFRSIFYFWPCFSELNYKKQSVQTVTKKKRLLLLKVFWEQYSETYTGSKNVDISNINVHRICRHWCHYFYTFLFCDKTSQLICWWHFKVHMRERKLYAASKHKSTYLTWDLYDESRCWLFSLSLLLSPSHFIWEKNINQHTSVRTMS